MRLMLVIDEVHSSDPYMAVLTEGLLQDHLAAGGEAALLSATLGARTRVRYASIGRTENLNDIEMPPLAVAVAQPYPAITANAPFSAWDEVFPDKAMTIAAVDRLVHHATILEMNVESYRRRSAHAGQSSARPRARTATNTVLADPG